MVMVYEQRRAERSTVQWPVSVWHPQASRFFNGKSVNVSPSGALLSLPLKAPVREGQQLEVNFPRAQKLASEKGSFARIKSARVVRVERHDALASANVKVAVVFCNPAESSNTL
ncbi:MAG: PilZ domain-containing protein [Sedimentisphaerales bacterium]|nr:PilZ domain-containing protein [Sedimentisphaerales bacterium]